VDADSNAAPRDGPPEADWDPNENTGADSFDDSWPGVDPDWIPNEPNAAPGATEAGVVEGGEDDVLKPPKPPDDALLNTAAAAVEVAAEDPPKLKEAPVAGVDNVFTGVGAPNDPAVCVPKRVPADDPAGGGWDDAAPRAPVDPPKTEPDGAASESAGDAFEAGAVKDANEGADAAPSIDEDGAPKPWAD
jgi:hypothetical protein